MHWGGGEGGRGEGGLRKVDSAIQRIVKEKNEISNS